MSHQPVATTALYGTYMPSGRVDQLGRLAVCDHCRTPCWPSIFHAPDGDLCLPCTHAIRVGSSRSSHVYGGGGGAVLAGHVARPMSAVPKEGAIAR